MPTHSCSATPTRRATEELVSKVGAVVAARGVILCMGGVEDISRSLVGIQEIV